MCAACSKDAATRPSIPPTLTGQSGARFRTPPRDRGSDRARSRRGRGGDRVRLQRCGGRYAEPHDGTPESRWCQAATRSSSEPGVAQDRSRARTSGHEIRTEADDQNGPNAGRALPNSDLGTTAEVADRRSVNVTYRTRSRQGTKRQRRTGHGVDWPGRWEARTGSRVAANVRAHQARGSAAGESCEPVADCHWASGNVVPSIRQMLLIVSAFSGPGRRASLAIGFGPSITTSRTRS